MMKTTFLFFILIFSIQNSFGQAVLAKNIVLQPYFALAYGGDLLKAKEPADFNLKNSQLNAIGLNSEYFISNKISFGLDFNTRSQTRSFSRSTLVYDPITATDVNIAQKFVNKVAMHRIYVRMTYHVATRNTRVNLYGGYALGLKYTVDKRYLEGIRQNFYEAGSQSGQNQYSIRLFVGGRYFVTRRIAIGGELGLGGPLAAVGLSIKM
jgi:hypothetical protein